MDDITRFLLSPSTFISFLFVWGTVLLAVFVIDGGLRSKSVGHIKNLAVPVGLVGSLIGTTALLDGHMTDNFARSVSDVYSAAAAMMLTMIFGGILAASAYFLEQKNPPDKDSSVKTSSQFRAILALVFGFAPIFVLMQQQQRSLDAWLSPTPLLLTASLLVFAWLASEKSNRYQLLSNACLCSSIIGLLMGVTLVFVGDLPQGLSVAGNSLNYGLLAYIAIYIIAATQGASNQLNAWLLSWHWMEIAGFFVFMFLAPQTIIDIVDQAEMMQTINALQHEVQSLKNQMGQ
ncbi:MAG: hypothetical protein ACPGPF_10775 [Pontibacterium sp.]